MILTFHGSQQARGRDYVISIVYNPEKIRKYQIIGKSCHGEIRSIILVFPFDLQSLL